jgi:hypothetical protein
MFLLNSVFPFRPKDCTLHPASPWVNEELKIRLSERNFEMLGHFTDLATSRDITFNVPSGQSFEKFVIKFLEKGGTFTVKNILDRKRVAEEHLILPPLKSMCRSNDTFFKDRIEPETLLLPEAKNFKGVDFVFFVNNILYLGQVTLNYRKKILLETWIEFNTLLDSHPTEVAVLYFLKKDKNFDQFQLGGLKKLNSWNASGKSPKFTPKKAFIINE